MKTKLFNITLICLGLCLFTACADFLDKVPKEELSDGSFWKTEKDAEMAVSNLYNYLGWWPDDAITTDDATMGIKWAAGNEAVGVYDPSDYDWSNDYKYIRSANLALSKLSEMSLNDDVRKLLEGQAYFFRGYIYFNLIRTFGAVPYVDKPLTISDLNDTKQSTREEVYAKLMSDLDKAILYLPMTWDADKDGRITRGAAQAVKMRAALYYGDYQTTADMAKEIISSGVYELYDNGNTGKYAELFWEKSDGCKENILYIPFKAPDKTNYIIGWEAFPTLGWGGMDPTQDLVDAFEDVDGSPIYESSEAGLIARDTDGKPKGKVLSAKFDPTIPFKNRDPRLEVNVLHDGETMYGTTIKVAPHKSSGNTGIGQHGDATETGYYQQKWLDPAIHPSSDGWSMGKDEVIIRYAEVLLSYAEAMNELNGPCTEAFGAVNQVRARVGMPPLQNSDPTKPTYCSNKNELRKRITNEWRVEFCLEGDIRKWNLRRWGDSKEMLNRKYWGMSYTLELNADGSLKSFVPYRGKHIQLKGSHYEDYNYLFPIPQKEMDLNKNLKQNQGYKDTNVK